VEWWSAAAPEPQDVRGMEFGVELKSDMSLRYMARLRAITGILLVLMFAWPYGAWAEPLSHGWSSYGVPTEAMVFDDNNNLIVLGYVPPVSKRYYPDSMLVEKFDITGNRIWRTSFVYPGRMRDVGVDAAGNVLFTGMLNERVDFGGGVLVPTDGDLLIVKLTAFGEHVWSKRYGEPPGTASGEHGYRIAVDPSGAFVVTGTYSGTMLLGPHRLHSFDFRELFVAKFDSSGNPIWARGEVGGRHFPSGVALSATGEVVIAGNVSGDADFGGGVLLDGTRLGSDAYLAKYDPGGGFLWAHRFAGDTQYCADLGLDPSGNPIVAGKFRTEINFGGGPLVATSGNIHTYVAKFSAAGAHIWSKQFGSSEPATSIAWGIACDNGGNVAITGEAYGAGLTVGGDTLAVGGDKQVYLSVLSADGEEQWGRFYGDGCEQRAWVIAGASDGRVAIYGDFLGAVDFGGGALVNPHRMCSHCPWESDCDYVDYIVQLNPVPVAAAIQSFVVREVPGGVELDAVFSSNLELERINVYKAESGEALRLHKALSGPGRSLPYIDRSVEPGRTYAYMLGIVDADGEVVSAVRNVTVKGYQTALIGNHPNPFNPITTIAYTLAAPGLVTIYVYDPSGRFVRKLIERHEVAGWHEVVWDGTDEKGRVVSSGVYFCQMRVGNVSESRRMVLLK